MVTQEGKFLFHNDRKAYEEGYFLGRATYEMPGRFDGDLIERMFRLANRRFFMRPLHLARIALKRLYSPSQFPVMIRKFLKVIFRGRQM